VLRPALTLRRQETLPRQERDALVRPIVTCAREVAAKCFVFCFVSVLYAVLSPNKEWGTVAFALSVVITLNGLFVLVSIQTYVTGSRSAREKNLCFKIFKNVPKVKIRPIPV